VWAEFKFIVAVGCWSNRSLSEMLVSHHVAPVIFPTARTVHDIQDDIDTTAADKFFNGNLIEKLLRGCILEK
jgi:hypothetical protein